MLSTAYTEDEVNMNEEFSKFRGRYVLSDDSHNVSQVGFGYESILIFLERIGIGEMAVLQKGLTTGDARFPGVFASQIHVTDLKDHTFFKQ